MDETLAKGLLDVGSKLIGTQQSTPHRAPVDPAAPKFHKENAVVGVTLNDYTDREPSEDGKYVKVTVHRERIEMIEQPPTPLEIAEKKEQQKHVLKFSAVIAVGLLGVAGILNALERKQQRKVEVRTDGS